MKKTLLITFPTLLLFSCTGLSKNELIVETDVPMLSIATPDVASHGPIPAGSKIFVIYADEIQQPSSFYSSSVIISDGSVNISTSSNQRTGTYLTPNELVGEFERRLINKGFRPTLANLINNDQLYMDSKIMLDRVASLGKSVNAPYTLLIRKASLHYSSNPTAYVRAIKCKKVSIHPLLGHINAVVLKNDSGEILTSVSYTFNNIENSINTQPMKLRQFSAYKYYDYVEGRYFNIPGSNWPACDYELTYERGFLDNQCWGMNIGQTSCPLPIDTYKAYVNKLLSAVVDRL